MTQSNEPATMVTAIAALEAEGYTGQFTINGDGIRCPRCHCMHTADRGLVERVVRFEGASDPDDEAILLGLRCPECGALGTFASGYGPSADPAIVDQLVMLDTRFRSG
jgi:DNA-directed RNA polymerase subunit RPC12/RpoP